MWDLELGELKRTGIASGIGCRWVVGSRSCELATVRMWLFVQLTNEFVRVNLTLVSAESDLRLEVELYVSR
jgi:hypothetical protein